MIQTLFLPLTLLLSNVAALEIIHSKQLEFNMSSRSGSTVAAAWYTGWHAADFPLSQVSWSKYTNVIYASALTTPDVTALS